MAGAGFACSALAAFAAIQDPADGPSVPGLGELCGTPDRNPFELSLLGGPGDCGASSNDPDPIYAPSEVRELTLVVHVIERSDGAVHLDPGRIARQMRGEGSDRVSDRDFALLVDSAPPGASGLVLLGSGPAQRPFGDGTLCVSSPIRRIPASASTDASGRATVALDLEAWPLVAEAVPGTISRFQHWFRDPTGGPAGVNLSNGLAVLWR